jgi:hypothetical protein
MEKQAQANSRQGQCYSLALAVMQFQFGSETFVLVHGRVAGIPHAWIAIDDGKTVYDPVLHGFIDAADYPAVPDCRYTKKEALELAELTGTCGPWAT